MHCRFRRYGFNLSPTQQEYEGFSTGIMTMLRSMSNEKYPDLIKKCKEEIVHFINKNVTSQFIKPVQDCGDKNRDSTVILNCMILYHLKDAETDVVYLPNVKKTEFERQAKSYLKRCKVCSKEGTKRCGKCGCAYYCSADCQKSHWKEHKKVCGVAEK